MGYRLNEVTRTTSNFFLPKSLLCLSFVKIYSHTYTQRNLYSLISIMIESEHLSLLNN